MVARGKGVQAISLIYSFCTCSFGVLSSRNMTIFLIFPRSVGVRDEEEIKAKSPG